MAISPVPELVAELAAGRMVILVDEEDRENEGDLVLAADHVSPESINFMAKFGRGLICLTLTRERCERLQLPPMATRNGTRHGTAFTVSIEALHGVTTGISAHDRSRTVQAAVARDAVAADLVQPGHIFPLQAQDGGVLLRAGHTEAGCEPGRMAGLNPRAVICEVMKDDGTMGAAARPRCVRRRHGLKIGTIADLIEYRSRHETLIERVGQRTLVTAQGEFECSAFRDRTGGLHLALTHGRWTRRRGAGASARAALGDGPARGRPVRPIVAAAEGAAGDPGQPARRGRAAQLRRRRRRAAGPVFRRTTSAPSASAARWTCAPTASARRSCASSASRR
jgi:3,4-dihydroxy 2-butanone 4-phosphate synthase/GTP cyclohydrolase II